MLREKIIENLVSQCDQAKKKKGDKGSSVWGKGNPINTAKHINGVDRILVMTYDG